MPQTTTLSHEPDSIAMTFQKSGNRETARYVSSTSVCVEALQDTRWIGLYWSASGQVQRENVTAGLPGRSTLEFALHAFELEIDGQDLRDLTLASLRDAISIVAQDVTLFDDTIGANIAMGRLGSPETARRS